MRIFSCQTLNMLFVTAVCIFFVSCRNLSQASFPADEEEYKVISVAGAMENLQECLKLSDLGKSVRYIPLETNDSCLVTLGPVYVWRDYILVNAGEGLYSFERETGRFITQVGHRGEDPTGYYSATPYCNDQNGLLYFVRKPNVLQKYNAFGEYQGGVPLPASPAMPCFYAFIDSCIVGYHEFLSFNPFESKLLSVFDEAGMKKDSVLRSGPKPVVPDGEPTIVGGRNLGGCVVHYALYPGGGLTADLLPFTPLWKCGSDLRLYKGYNDTLFTWNKAHGLFPAFVFHYGKWKMDEQSLQEWNSHNRLITLSVVETPERIYFVCVKNLFETLQTGYKGLTDFELYQGVYDKQTGVVRMAPEKNGIVDDLTGDLSFTMQNRSSSDGEFVLAVEAHKVVAWLEEHPEAKDNPQLAPLLKVQEEDNPVVVIVSDK